MKEFMIIKVKKLRKICLRHLGDILLFLSELKGGIAKKIYNNLIKINTNNGGEKK